MASFDDLCEQVQQQLQPFFRKPKLSTKLLSKPPFRFIHDIVSNMTAATGFAAGLYEGVELDGKAMKDKGLKLQYIEKLLGYLEQQGESVDVRPSKVLAGAQVENTMEMLLAIARVGYRLQQGGAGDDGAAAAAEEQKERERQAAAEREARERAIREKQEAEARAERDR